MTSWRGTHVYLRDPWTMAETAEAAAALRQASASLCEAVENALPDMAAMSVTLELLEAAEQNSAQSEQCSSNFELLAFRGSPGPRGRTT